MIRQWVMVTTPIITLAKPTHSVVKHGQDLSVGKAVAHPALMRNNDMGDVNRTERELGPDQWR